MISFSTYLQLKRTKQNNENDSELLNSFIRGSSSAFALLYNKYVDELFAYGISLGFNRETVKDALHDVFYKFHARKKDFKEVTNLKFYLFRMLKNRLLDLSKSTLKEEPLGFENTSFLVGVSISDNLIEEEERKELEKRVNQLLNVLTQRQKEAIYLRFIQEMEYDEVATLLQMTAPAVRKLISRAVKRMREENS